MTQLTRRTLLQAAAVSPALAVPAAQSATPSDKEGAMNGDAFGFQHTPVPLPFDAGTLRGISEKLIRSHWENNYVGASKALNTVRGRLTQALGDPDTPPYVYTGLKREQSIRTGSVVLHELYFANLGGDGKPSADLRTRIAGIVRHLRQVGKRIPQDRPGSRGRFGLGRAWIQPASQTTGELLARGSRNQPGIHEATARHGHV